MPLLPSFRITLTDERLHTDSQIMADKVTSIKAEKVHEAIGTLDTISLFIKRPNQSLRTDCLRSTAFINW